ncbi:MAG: glutamate-5-semialdehyde dehydrogenase [Gammaproteobacteria bacterium]|nr:glutamate-5-semialdehyde dehydrogenase [Gammaproteobacteria bacterium]HJL95833.1 glutamate-5-semialdehyde dehydrogenase [SAR86 cluster bacterium]|tara:strand:- start:23965 stop:25233 length:1269 start_codon:yes stop_codon:yes gene_type:complete
MSDSKDINIYMDRLGSLAKNASRELSLASEAQKNKALHSIGKKIDSKRHAILKENIKDLEEAKKKDIGDALVDRLELNEARIDSMISGLEVVSELPDPVGEVTDLDATPSGIRVSKMRVPLGVVGIIYESRPNVTADAAALCLKSGNSCILRGGSEAILSNKIIWDCLQEGLEESGLSKDIIQLVETTDREAVKTLLHMDKWVDVIIPRGGKGLVKLISEESRVPVIKHLDGICHVYVDEDALLNKAVDIVLNAKTYRFGICGAMETLLLHRNIATDILPQLLERYESEGVELRGCEETVKVINVKKANDEDWATEYLAPVLSIKIVKDLAEAIGHINTYGSNHTDSIVTENNEKVQSFFNQVDSSSVMHNLPTCWADGFEYGLGAEVGISTDKIHARGPVGLEGLTSQKFIVKGNSELRGS